MFLYIIYLRKSIENRVQKRFQEKKKEIKRNTLKRSRSSIKGKVSEQLAPLTKKFDYNSSDARFIGSPIDYIIFDGYTRNKDGDGQKDISIVFADIKSGNSRLSKIQRKIKNAIQDKKIKWETIRVGDD